MSQSSRQYIAMKMKTAASDEPVDKNFVRITRADVHRCDHTSTICMTARCVESWSSDWRLFLDRTHAGRDFARVLGLTEQQINTLAEDSPLSSSVRLTSS